MNNLVFLKNRSTTTQLLVMLDEFYDFIQNGNNIDVIYIDFKKAFDSVPIKFLLQKINNIGIRGNLLKFIENFLSDRSFKVKIGENYSDSFSSILGYSKVVYQKIQHKILHNFAFYTFGLTGLTKKFLEDILSFDLFFLKRPL